MRSAPWEPVRVGLGLRVPVGVGVPVGVFRADRCDRSPKIVKVLGLEASDKSIRQRDILHRLDGPDKDQAKRLYGICQQMEQKWREKRRIREMEEARARAGGIVMGAPAAAPAEDPVGKLPRPRRFWPRCDQVCSENGVKSVSRS